MHIFEGRKGGRRKVTWLDFVRFLMNDVRKSMNSNSAPNPNSNPNLHSLYGHSYMVSVVFSGVFFSVDWLKGEDSYKDLLSVDSRRTFKTSPI